MPLNFNTNYLNNFPVQAQTAFGRALKTWGTLLDSDTTIEIVAIWGAYLPETLSAICIPNPLENFQNAPAKDTWYPSALADKLSRQDLRPIEPDMTILFSNNVNWYLGVGIQQSNQLDLESVSLHEICHGLGFVSAFWVERGWPYVGSYGNNALITQVQKVVQGAGQQLGFALPNLNFHPTVYGLHIQDLSGEQLTNVARYPVNSSALGPPLVSHNLFFDLSRHQVYAPDPFVPFTSIDHLNDQKSLMRPAIEAGTQVRKVDPAVLEILQALGW
jgi:hypothetical protein